MWLPGNNHPYYFALRMAVVRLQSVTWGHKRSYRVLHGCLPLIGKVGAIHVIEQFIMCPFVI